MYPILVSIDEGLYQRLFLEDISISFLLKFAILREESLDFSYYHVENTKNIRLNLQAKEFFILNSICKENNCYMNEIAGELITEVYLDLLQGKVLIEDM
ncbi:MAG: hypothetical protein IPL26_16310 [Leptospiraceae bacterium]|nr:hypothetical protein [Leptospiraceae bacterium]